MRIAFRPNELLTEWMNAALHMLESLNDNAVLYVLEDWVAIKQCTGLLRHPLVLSTVLYFPV